MLFASKTIASAILFKTVRNTPTPIFLANVGDGASPPGQNILTPDGRILLFFRSSTSKTMFSYDALNTASFVVEYFKQPRAAVAFDANGMWGFQTGVPDQAEAPPENKARL